MRTDANADIRKSLTSKNFRAASANGGHPQLNSAGSGFESLAAHNSPGHASVLGFVTSVGHL